MDISYLDRQKYNTRHGGPFDRGEADSYYSRQENSPHYYVENTGLSKKVLEDDMTESEIESYWAGFYWNEKYGCKKEYS